MECISLDSVLGCEVCFVVVIYDPNYIINNFAVLTTESKPYLHNLSGDVNWVLQVLLMRIISINMSALPPCKVGDKQQRSDNRDIMTVEFPTRVIIYVLKSD